jgi:uncharacterized protein (TIGR02145 family)
MNLKSKQLKKIKMVIYRYSILLAFMINFSFANIQNEEQIISVKLKNSEVLKSPQSSRNKTNIIEIQNKQSKEYDYVVIGTQVWMSKNLDVNTFQNGDPIPQVKNDEEWKKVAKNKSPAWCYYEYNVENGIRFGKLYNWYAVNDKRGLAPKGWRIPKNQDWDRLLKQIGNPTYNAKDLLSIQGWSFENGTNKTGFNAQPAGGRFLEKFEQKGESACFWGADDSKIKNDGFERGGSLFLTSQWFLNDASGYPKEYCLSVRCIKQ